VPVSIDAVMFEVVIRSERRELASEATEKVYLIDQESQDRADVDFARHAAERMACASVCSSMPVIGASASNSRAPATHTNFKLKVVRSGGVGPLAPLPSADSEDSDGARHPALVAGVSRSGRATTSFGRNPAVLTGSRRRR